MNSVEQQGVLTVYRIPESLASQRSAPIKLHRRGLTDWRDAKSIYRFTAPSLFA